MTIILSFAALWVVLNYFLYKYIHKYRTYIYIVAGIISAISLTQEVNIINLGYVGFSFFLAVMFTGVVDKSNVKKSMVATRAEMAILGTIFIIVHGIKYFVYILEYKDIFGEKAYFYIGIFSLLVAIPLFLTSFIEIRKKINGKLWKKLHKLSYIFYLSIGLHLILIQNTRMYFYIGIFGLYFILRVWTLIEKKSNKKPQKKIIQAS
ncbi:MAG: ferric reductase-like transmembrane domain-containing protein [Firmicutes bacterium]|nr:ferric reductase-like transmembrane domain-containing protein [Bacillota bacterium]